MKYKILEDVPLLCLGGPEDANHLEKVKTLEHMELILAINGMLS